MNSDVHIRPYRSSDLYAVVTLWHASKRDAFPYVQVQQTYTMEDDMKHFREVISQECSVWLAETHGRILGLIALKDDLIDQLFIMVGEQRKGIGTQLLRKAMELSPDGLRVFTFQRNYVAREFYEKNGFWVVRFGVSPKPENEPDIEYAWVPERRCKE